MEYIISEILKRRKSSLMKIILVGILSIILLNICITLTNEIGMYQDLICLFLLIIYCLIMYYIFRKMIYVYSYNLGEDCINFQKHVFRRNKSVITINIKDIKIIDKYTSMNVNPDIKKTYYFIYGFVDSDCYYCEYEVNKKIYRFIFKPTERLVRILERKIKIR